MLVSSDLHLHSSETIDKINTFNMPGSNSDFLSVGDDDWKKDVPLPKIIVYFRIITGCSYDTINIPGLKQTA